MMGVVPALAHGQKAKDEVVPALIIAAEGAAAQAAANTAGANDFWVKAVGDAKPRTADNLGIKYPVISEQLYTAIQLALSGGASPTDALTAAQAAAEKNLG